MDPITLTPIGVVRTALREPEDAPIQGALVPDEPGRVELLAELAPALVDLDGFSHVVLLYVFHRVQGWRPQVVPYLEGPPHGVFATRAPRRPNPLGMTVVRLVRVEGSTLVVEGIDVLDGTPVLDVKPWVPGFDQPAEARVGWLEGQLAEPRRVRADRRFHR